MYKYDTHVHTSEVSDCGTLSAVETIRLYHEKRYDGVVITDHFTEDFVKKYQSLSWEAQIEKFLKGYHEALACGEVLGMTVMLGMELRLVGSSNEYLLYGLTPELLCGTPGLHRYTLKKLRTVTKKRGVAVYQAHPFRRAMKAMPPELLDGCEVYNGNPRHFSNNEKAEAYAKKNHLLMLSGSDCHMPEDVGRGGVVMQRRVTTAGELADEAAAGRIRLIRDGEADV